MQIMRANGTLNRGQCIRLWELLGRTDAPPSRVQVVVKASDVDRVVRDIKARRPK